MTKDQKDTEIIMFRGQSTTTWSSVILEEEITCTLQPDD